jgi:hypothetical protein
METSGDQAAQQQHDHSAQQDQQHSSKQLSALRVPAALLAHSSIARDQGLVIKLLQASKQVQAEVAAECAGQLAVSVGLYEHQSPSAQAFTAWLQHQAGLLRELHVELRCLGGDGSAVLQCLREQQQQLQALQCLALVSDSARFCNSLQDGWADPLLPHLPAGLRCLQLTGRRVTVQEDALDALSRLQQLTQLTVGWPCLMAATVQLQHMPTTLHSLDLTCFAGGWDGAGQGVLAPLSQLQQLTELRIGKVQSGQLGQLPPALQQLDVTLLASKHDTQAAAWYQQHANIVRRLVLDGGFTEMRWMDLNNYLQDGWAVVLAAFPAAFDAVAQAAAAAVATELGAGKKQLPALGATSTANQAPAPQQTSTSATTAANSSTSSRYPLQSLQVVHMPWLLDGETLSSLPASSLTELECSVDSGCERLVTSLSILTALHSLRIGFSRFKSDYCRSLLDLPDSALAPLSALLQLTQLHLGHVRAQQLAHLQLPQLQQLRAFVARVYPIWQDDYPPQQIDVSHLSSLTLLHINSCWMQGDGFPSSLRAVTWEFPSGDFYAPEVAERLSSEMILQPLLQLGALEKHFTFLDLRPAQLQHGLLHRLVHVHNDWRSESKSGMEVVWRMAASAAEQDADGGVQPAAAETSWGAVPLKSLRLMYDKLHHGFASMPMATVQALGALQLTELAIHGGGFHKAHLGLEVTPAQLGEVLLQRLPLLQRLDLEYFALLCDTELTLADVSELAQQQQQQQEVVVRMQPYHSAAGVAALVSAIGQLPNLQALQLQLPLLLNPAANLQEVESAIERWLPRVGLQNNVQLGCSFLPLFILRRIVC